MSEDKVTNRWFVVVGALLVQLCLGAIYAWGTFTKDLQNSEADVAMYLSPELLGVTDKAQCEAARAEYDELTAALKAAQEGKDTAAIAAAKDALAKHKAALDKEWVNKTFDRKCVDKHVYCFTETQSQAIFSLGLATFAVVMIMAGRWQDKRGPRMIAIIGGITLGAGYILAGLLGGTSFTAILLFIGLVGGAGIGLGYVCPIAACVKWFPDMKGFVTGLAVAGFGAGAFIFIKLAGQWVHLIHDYGISGTFIMFGIIFAVFVTLGGSLLCNPPAGWKPAGWNPPAAAAKKSVRDLTQGQTVFTPQFWMIWAAFVFSGGTGLMVIGCLKSFGEKEGGLTAAAAGSALGLLALFNGLGRVVWGTISQKLSARYSVVLMTALQAVMLFLLPSMGSSTLKLAIAGCWVGFNFGGNFALFPLLTNENFGSKNLGANYGAVFTAYGVGGILGPIMAGRVWDMFGTFSTAFCIAGVACILACIIGVLLRPIKPHADVSATAKA
ncbi:MAG TPA: OFA family MFS transporter [Planctomycetota bacterium]|nr:OFA family MFS transporter [Planctomycetota bacterium]